MFIGAQAVNMKGDILHCSILVVVCCVDTFPGDALDDD